MPLFRVDRRLFSGYLSKLVYRVLGSLSLVVYEAEVMVVRALSRVFFFVVSYPMAGVGSGGVVLFRGFLVVFSRGKMSYPVYIGSTRVF